MPKIRISDSVGLELLTADSGPGSGISKYFKGDVAGFIAGAELTAALAKPASSLAAGPLGLGMNFGTAGAFGAASVGWKISAGARVSVQATQAGATLPGDAGIPIAVEPGNTFVSVSFSPTLSTGLSHGVADLQFGFSAGGTVEFRAGRAFSLGGGPGPGLGDALKSLLATGVVPGNVLDLMTMEEGDVASVSGSGNLRCSASFDVARAVNPLVSPTLPLAEAGKVSIEAGASLEVGASVAIKGNYQIRVRKLGGGRVVLGYYKMAGTEVRFDVTASAGVAVNLGKTEVLATLMCLVGSSKADANALKDGGLSGPQIKDIQSAIEASLSRTIEVSLAGSFSTAQSHSKMFEYELELDRLNTAGVDAVNSALHGDLSPLTSRVSTDLPSGIRLLVSEFEEVRKKKTAWKLNFLGIVNVLTITELVRKGKVLFNAQTGELVVTDSVTAKKLRVDTRPLEAESKKLHSVLMQSLVMTAAYTASGTKGLQGSLKASMSYFEQTLNADRRTISNYLDNFVAAKLMSPDEKESFLTRPVQGRASVYLDTAFSDTDFSTMFFDESGAARKAEYYESLGRDAVAKLTQPGDENAFRRLPMVAGDTGSDRLWKAMSDAGPASLHTVLPASLKSGPALAILRHDYIVIKWWARSMAKAGVAANKMKDFLATNQKEAEELQDDPAFLKRREELSKALKDVASDALPDFLDAWGILSMDAAAGGKSALHGTLLTAGSALVKHRLNVQSLSGGRA